MPSSAFNRRTFLQATAASAAALAYVDQKVSSAAQQFKSFHPTWPSE